MHGIYRIDSAAPGGASGEKARVKTITNSRDYAVDDESPR